MTSYSPLNGPDDVGIFPTSVDGEVHLARQLVAEQATANIHDHRAMMIAAVSLDFRLRSLIAALDAERGERP